MRVVLLIIDSFGIGALPDAGSFGDEGANTAGHICESVQTVNWPNLKKLGLGNIAEVLGNELSGCSAVSKPTASYAALAEVSAGKDTVTGHWELAGIRLEQPFHVFPSGPPSFPHELIEPFTKKFSCGILGNCAASGTEIIQRLGAQHLESHDPILYTSADSVVQVAAHESIYPLEKIYEMCRFLRDQVDSIPVGRVIARPFVGEPGSFERSSGRKDFAMKPPQPNLLSRLQKSNIETIGIGKIGDIFSHANLDRDIPEKGNPACMKALSDILSTPSENSQFLFVNLVDTDMIYGHRRDPQGYHDAVASIDKQIPDWIECLNPDDRLIISADHGCDPTFRGTDHTREFVPFLAYGSNLEPRNLDLQEGLDFCTQYILDHYGLNH